jgi:hypothetical protein
MKLGLKRVPPRFYVSTGFGEGHFVFRKIQTGSDGKCFRVCESVDGMQRWEEPIKMPSIEAYGLHRLENGRIVSLGV